jgi:hypothetical protein
MALAKTQRTRRKLSQQHAEFSDTLCTRCSLSHNSSRLTAMALAKTQRTRRKLSQQHAEFNDKEEHKGDRSVAPTRARNSTTRLRTVQRVAKFNPGILRHARRKLEPRMNTDKRRWILGLPHSRNSTTTTVGLLDISPRLRGDKGGSAVTEPVTHRAACR